MISIFTPRYSHPFVGKDEKIGRSIADMQDDPSENPMPSTCGDCGATGTIKNPLMMRPLFLMDHGGPRGTLYQARCAHCQEKRVARRVE